MRAPLSNAIVIANLVGHREDSAEMFEQAMPVMINALLAAFGLSAVVQCTIEPAA